MAAIIAKSKAAAIQKLQTLRVESQIAKSKQEFFVFKYEIDNKEILSIAIEPETEMYAKGYVRVYVPYPKSLKGFEFSSQVKLYQYKSQKDALNAAIQYALKFIQARK